MGPIDFPQFDPAIVHLGPLAIRWYALAYIVGLLFAWRYCMRLTERPPQLVTAQQIDDFLVWATLGVILGARLGFVLLYQPGHYLAAPLDVFKVWNGGMSFHGGLAGVTVAMLVFTRRNGIPLLGFTDLIAAAAPAGLFLGRIANFINGELWGRPTDGSWGVIFRHVDDLPRHPSQLYEATFEGLVLFTILAVLVLGRTRALTRPGLTTGVFLTGYGVSRIAIEFFREPDSYIGLLPFGTSWGQWLTLPLAAGGLYLVGRALRRPALRGA